MADKEYRTQDFSSKENPTDHDRNHDQGSDNDTHLRNDDDESSNEPEHNSINTSDDEPVDDGNVSDKASQNEDAQIDEPDDDEENRRRGIDEPDVDTPNPSNEGTFDDDVRSLTTADPDYQDDDNNSNGLDLQSEDLDALFAPIDSDLKSIKNQLDQHRNALTSLDTSQPEEALDKMRNILIQDNDTERKMYKLINQLEYNTVDYSEIKDKILKTGDQERLNTLLDELQPLFKVSSKKQMHTFVTAFNRIISIEENGSLSNLIQLAQYYDQYKDGEDSSHNGPKTGKDTDNDGTNDE